MTARMGRIDPELGYYRPSHYDMPPVRRPIHFECGGPSCAACALEQEIAERNER